MHRHRCEAARLEFLRELGRACLGPAKNQHRFVRLELENLRQRFKLLPFGKIEKALLDGRRVNGVMFDGHALGLDHVALRDARDLVRHRR